MLVLEIMKTYGWDWHTYQNQPTWVLELAKEKFVIEAKLEAQKAEQNKLDKNG